MPRDSRRPARTADRRPAPDEERDLSAAPLYSPARVRDLLDRHGLKPTKSLGQNFLIDGNILRAIAEAGGAAPGVPVLEIGPGLGVLTREIHSRGAQVTTLEKDERLRAVLAETLGDTDVQIIWGDALDFDYAGLPAGTRVIANLPYYIYQTFYTAHDYGLASAAGVIVVVLTIAVATIALRTVFSLFQEENR